LEEKDEDLKKREELENMRAELKSKVGI